MIYEISHVHFGGDEVNRTSPVLILSASASAPTDSPLPNANLQSEPPTRSPTPEPVFDATEVLKRIGTVQRENLQRLDDDIAISYQVSEEGRRYQICRFDSGKHES